MKKLILAVIVSLGLQTQAQQTVQPSMRRMYNCAASKCAIKIFERETPNT